MQAGKSADNATANAVTKGAATAAVGFGVATGAVYLGVAAVPAAALGVVVSVGIDVWKGKQIGNTGQKVYEDIKKNLN